jgi:hypothetical protein
MLNHLRSEFSDVDVCLGYLAQDNSVDLQWLKHGTAVFR